MVFKSTIDEDNPDWLAKSIVEDNLPWNMFSKVNLNEFLTKYTLHDSAWIKLIVDSNGFNNVLIIIRIDSVWFPSDDVEKSSWVSQWPILFLEINDVDHIDFKNYTTESGRTIRDVKTKDCEDCYKLEIEDIYGGVLTITYLGDTKALIVNNQKEIINIQI